MNQPMEREREFEFREDDFRFISSLVHKQTGIVLAEHKKDMVYARIARRLRSLRLTTFRDYCSLLESDRGEEEIGNFVNAVTTNLTSFFREGHHFEHLSKQAFKSIVADPPAGRRLRLWSAACSSGAEPYSMAMTGLESIPDIARWDIKILATDIDTGMLAKSAAGEYNESELEPIPAALRTRYINYDKKTGMGRMNDALKKLITFKPLNLIEPWPFKGPFDAVFCRNVVIYFDKNTQKELFDKIADRMKPQGWLYIGHSETLHSVSKRFKLCDKTTYQRVL